LNAIVAGHICLDIIPGLEQLPPGQFTNLFQPGHLLQVGPVNFSTGGLVSNTGLALYRLGVPTRLVAKVGADPFGEIVRSIIKSYDPLLADGIVTDASVSTSYTIVINPPGIDRIFFHSPGANDSFTSRDIGDEQISGAHLLHFGYPSAMRPMYQAGGKELVEILQRAKANGATTSLDMAFPDPTAEAGRADWRVILGAALPWVDIFLPSLEEILFMLRHEAYEQLCQSASGSNILPVITPELVSDVGQELLAMGVKIVGLKLGSLGLYLRTASRPIIATLGCAAPNDTWAWAERELWAPCFQVKVVGTTGSGDATIAGFLSALLRDFSPEAALTTAVAVGACNVEAADALSGIRTWEATQERIAAGWPRHSLALKAPGWRFDLELQLWIGPADKHNPGNMP
jgi:sugar/nucleoside kinase (ribokinase family)